MSDESVERSERTALVLGATGLVGRELVDLLLEDDRYARVRVLGRRPLRREHPKLQQYVVDFDRLAERAELFRVDDVFCCLGSTLSAAGSQEAFRQVDHDYVVEAARLAADEGADQFLVVSALGADSSSPFFYNRVKGEMEIGVKHLPFRALWIVRPSLLRGEREEFRIGEQIADVFSRALWFVFVGPLRRYRPVEARDVARLLRRLAADEGTGGVIESEEIPGLAAAR